MSSNTFQVSAGTSFNRIKVAELLSTAVQKLDRKQEGGRVEKGREREGGRQPLRSFSAATVP